jgi:hypothetical protein
MAKKKKVQWKPGDVFCAPLPDGQCCLGQALGLMGEYVNVVNCVLFDIRFRMVDTAPSLDPNKVIAVVSTTRDLLDEGHWPIVGHAPIFIKKSNWPNEQFAKKDYVGAKTYGSGIVNDFLAAYYGLFPWDGYKEPDYFDKMLSSPSKKPSNSILKFKDS